MHILQPKHTKLKDDEAIKLLEKYNIVKEQLPRIRNSDPALTELNVKKGDVIKIARKSGDDAESEYFRVVV